MGVINTTMGGNVSLSLLEAVFNKQGAPTCKPDCRLEEICTQHEGGCCYTHRSSGFCMGRDAAGFPTDMVTCPAGTLASNSCRTRGCTSVALPLFASPGAAPAPAPLRAVAAAAGP